MVWTSFPTLYPPIKKLEFSAARPKTRRAARTRPTSSKMHRNRVGPSIALLLCSFAAVCLLAMLMQTMRGQEQTEQDLILEHRIAPPIEVLIEHQVSPNLTRLRISASSPATAHKRWLQQSQPRESDGSQRRRLLSSCGTGSYFDGSSCVDCARGTYGVGGICEACEAGKYSSRAGSSSCTACQAGKFSARWAHSCSSCPSGKYSAASNATSGKQHL